MHSMHILKSSCRLQGAWLWPVKDYIDRKFMSMYSSGLDHMADQMAKSGKPAAAVEPAVATAAGPEALAAVSAAKMRCGGCGGKVTYPRSNYYTEHIVPPYPLNPKPYILPHRTELFSV